MLKMNDFNDCIAGVVERCGQPSIMCYDKTKVINKLVEDGMPLCEAVEYYDFNQAGAWVGELTPCYITFLKDPNLDEYE